MTTKPNATTQGVENAWDFWLSQHDAITVPDAIESAINKSFTGWLDAHSDELITAIAEAVAKRGGGAT